MARLSVPLALLLAVILQLDRAYTLPEGDSYTASWAVQVIGGEKMAEEIARRNGFENIGKVRVAGFHDIYEFKLNMEKKMKVPDEILSKSKTFLLRSEANVILAEQQTVKERVPKSYSVPQDPLFADQWHWLNTGQQGSSYVGNDLEVEKAWLQGITGCNVTVGVVDDGLHFRHPDMYNNYAVNVSYDFVDEDTDPTAGSHGTNCAGLAAASRNDEACGVGAGYDANLGGLRLLGATTDLNEARALSYANDIVDVYSNSWGPSDTGSLVSGPGTLMRAALRNGTVEGRGGKGSIFVWANGNGGYNNDDCAADGYTISIYTISVGALSVDGNPSGFDEPCSAKMVTNYVTAAAGGGGTVVTTGINDGCTFSFSGTSAATPMASGIITLALEANPELTWRDVQYLVVYTSNPNKTTDLYTMNAAGILTSREFGFGVMDAEAMVTRAHHWINVPPQLEHITDLTISGTATEFSPFETTVTYTDDIVYLEHIVVTMTVEATIGARGNIQIVLTSPAGTDSTILGYRSFDSGGGSYFSWPFMSVMFWGENPNGQWTLSVQTINGATASASGISFQFYGTSETPEAVSNIPDQCHEDCAKGCAAEGAQYCDACVNLRNAYTLECIDSCPLGYMERNGYCYDATEPEKTCDTALKEKQTGSCVDAGFTECCTEGVCSVLDPFLGTYCFCDNACFELEDCCSDIAEIDCMAVNDTTIGIQLSGTVLRARWEPIPGQTVLSYTLNCSVGDEEVLSVETSDLSLYLGLYEPYTTYVCSVWYTGIFGSSGIVVSNTSVTTGGLDVEAYLPFVPEVNANGEISTGDDVTHFVNLNDFAFGDTSFTLAYIGSNGIISFGSSYNPYINTLLANLVGLYVVAPFWDDINVSNGGTITYETFESGYYLEQVNAFIQREMSTSFTGTWMMNVYYQEVAPFGGSAQMQNTFQAILVTNATTSYAVFTYKCGLMGWDNGASIGFSANGDPYDDHDPSSSAIACLNRPGSVWNNVIYTLSEMPATPGTLTPVEDFTLSLTSTVLSATWSAPLGQITVEVYIFNCSFNNHFLSVNTTDTTVYLGLYETSTTYVCSVRYITTSGENGPSSTSLSVTTGGISEVAYLPFVPQVSNYSLILSGLDVSIPVFIGFNFPIGATFFSTIYVGNNGIISFGSVFTNYINTLLVNQIGQYLVAPFWDDANLNNGGRVSYETFQSGYYLEQVNAFIQREMSTSFTGTWMMNVYYLQVAPISGPGENTYQAILITDGVTSYTIFTYKCGLMEWDNGANIGFTASGNPYADHDPSSNAIACINSPFSDWSNVVYRITAEGSLIPVQNYVLSLSSNTVLTASWTPPTGQNINFYTFNCSVNNEEVLSVVTTETFLELGVYESDATYICSVSYITSTGVNGSATNASVTTGGPDESAYLPFVPQLANANLITTGDDVSRVVYININFTIGNGSFSTIYVGSNGIISFGSLYNSFVNVPLVSLSGVYAVAPFWDDINLSNNGQVSYETFESGYYLEQVNAFIQRERSTSFTGTWMMNVYYQEVAPLGGSGQNTFQAILITDEVTSYTVFTYKCGLMEWGSGANIGFTANGNPYADHDPSSNAIACLNSPFSDWSNVIYRLTVCPGCSQYAQCDSSTGFTCQCIDGYTGDGTYCEPIDDGPFTLLPPTIISEEVESCDQLDTSEYRMQIREQILDILQDYVCSESNDCQE